MVHVPLCYPERLKLCITVCYTTLDFPLRRMLNPVHISPYSSTNATDLLVERTTLLVSIDLYVCALENFITNNHVWEIYLQATNHGTLINLFEDRGLKTLPNSSTKSTDLLVDSTTSIYI